MFWTGRRGGEEGDEEVGAMVRTRNRGVFPNCKSLGRDECLERGGGEVTRTLAFGLWPTERLTVVPFWGLVVIARLNEKIKH